MRQRTRVSIALCTYNGARFLAQQLDSLLAQTYADIEVVAIDDGSTDDTVQILRSYAQLDSRITFSVNATNLGMARNFERALHACEGDYVAPCDQDDIWAPSKIATLLAIIKDHALAYCDSVLIDQHGAALGTRISEIVPMSTTADPLPFAFGNCVSGHAMLVRRDVVRRALPIPQGFFYDWWIAAVAASEAGIVYCPEPLVSYRQHANNVTEARLSEMASEAGVEFACGTVVESSLRQQKSPVDRSQYYRDTQDRLDALAGLHGSTKQRTTKLQRLWRARASQWISPALGWFMLRHRRELLSLTTMPVKKQKRFCRRFFLGGRLEELRKR